MKVVVASAFLAGMLMGAMLMSNDMSQEWRLQNLEAQDLHSRSEQSQHVNALGRLEAMQANLGARLAAVEAALEAAGIPCAHAAMLRLPISREVKQPAAGSTDVLNATSNASDFRNNSATYGVVHHEPSAASASGVIDTSNASSASGSDAVHPVPAAENASRGTQLSNATSEVLQTTPGASNAPAVRAPHSVPASKTQKNTGPNAPAHGPKTAVKTVNPAQAYAQALAAYEHGQYDQSRALFQSFLTTYPKHDLVPNAHYWTGEAWYAQHKFSEALTAFQHVISAYPRHHKVPDALLMSVHARLRLGDTSGAKRDVQALRDRFPGSRAAEQGRQALAQGGQSDAGGQAVIGG